MVTDQRGASTGDERRAAAVSAAETPGVLAKAAAIFDAFTPGDDGLSFTDLHRRTGLPKATLHRTIAEMMRLRWLENTGRRYHLGRAMFQLGMMASLERSLIEIGTPFLEDLYERTHETVHLGMREDTEVMYVSKIGGHRQVNSPSRLGGRMPLHATAIGKAILSFSPADVQDAVLNSPLERHAPRTVTNPRALRRQLDHIHTTGVSYEYEESTPGICCVAAPVRSPDDVAIAAVSVAGSVTSFRPDRHAPAVLAAAAGIGAAWARRERLRTRDH